MEKTTQQDAFRTPPPPEVFRTPSSRADRITKSLPPSGSRFRYTPLGTSTTDSTTLRRQREPQFTTPSIDTGTTPRTTLSRSTTFCSDAGDETTNTRWSRMEWKKLEQHYIKNNREYKRAGESFYMNESLQRVEDGKLEEKWTREHCIWRSQCLDTNAKFNNGLLPSERKKRKKDQQQEKEQEQEQNKRQDRRQLQKQLQRQEQQRQLPSRKNDK